MKGSVFLLCIALCLLPVLLPVADAACSRTGTTPYIPEPTYYVPGPDGTIYVESSPPGAVIYINDENKGHAPVTETGLWPGTYTVTAKLAGYEDFVSIETISGPFRSTVYCPMVPLSSGNGLYIVSTPPKANVYLDGIQKGTTPLMIRDPAAGEHEIRLRLSGYAEWKSTVSAPSGGTRTITAVLNETDGDLFQGINVTSSPPGAKIFLDGTEKGVTPRLLNNIAAGIHILELQYDGYKPWKSTIDVPDARIKDVPVTLVPRPENAPGWITVSSSPCNASVLLDGNYAGKTPAGSSLNLDSVLPGEHTIVISYPGYISYSTRADVSPNQVFALDATLMPVSGPLAKGTLSVVSDPAGATVFVDNRSEGTTPFVAHDIAAGDHEIVLRMNGYDDYSSDVLVTAGLPSSVSATLQPAKTSLHSPVSLIPAFAALGILVFLSVRRKD